jgi:glycosyltransferase involved in cell wall biosynthesis
MKSLQKQVSKKTIIHIIVGLNDGGAEAVMYRLCSADSQHQHIVISMMDEGKYGQLLRDAAVDVHCLGMPRGRVTLRGIYRLCRYLLLYKPSVVQTWMYHADLLGGVMAKLLGVRRVCWGLHHANLAVDAVKGSTGRIARLCGYLSRYVPDAIVSCSQEAVRVHSELGYDVNKFVIIPNGVDLSKFKPDLGARNRLRKSIFRGRDCFAIGMVARFDPQKDHANLISALAVIKQKNYQVRCLLVGTGMEASNSALMDLLLKHDVLDCVDLLGRRDDVAQLMCAMDLHVLSSYSEAFGNVLVEAMACGTPCVGTNVGDMPLIIGKSGWVVPCRDPQALAEGLIAAKEMHEFHPLQWQEKCRQARERVLQEFSIEKMRASYAAVWH